MMRECLVGVGDVGRGEWMPDGGEKQKIQQDLGIHRLTRLDSCFPAFLIRKESQLAFFTRHDHKTQTILLRYLIRKEKVTNPSPHQLACSTSIRTY
eukprot:scaffold1426_cov83-Cylindrotheca_fusiformis.AAC.3